jgi:hypothetical protein
MTRLLADRHHADLAESLLLLFEDRFGWEVYFPIGREWRDEGYWMLSAGTPSDEGVRQQFLDLDARHAPSGTHEVDYFTEAWPQHPQRQHKLVTVRQARMMAWDYVLASVTNNEEGYRRFAREVGAQFILQVGNVFQPVDWSADPIVLASAQIPIPRRRRGVIYHQEFSLQTFRHEPPDHLWGHPRIASFVNLFPRTGCYSDWLAARQMWAFPEWREYGIDTADGVIQPASAVGDAMRLADFIWHDKPYGDGYGHVIHNAFAVGRPVIGHATHYAGQLAGPLWDRSTGIMLEDSDWLTQLRAVWADPVKHLSMCAAAATRFREMVDFEADAAAVLTVLQ